MKLHVKQCRFCKRCAIRLDEEKQWCHWYRVGGIDAIAKNHKILTQSLEEVCADCNLIVDKMIATTAGVTH